MREGGEDYAGGGGEEEVGFGDWGLRWEESVEGEVAGDEVGGGVERLDLPD